MQILELKTQIFYLNRIFSILSDGFNVPSIIHNPDWFNPINEIKEEQKKDIDFKELDSLLDEVFEQLYDHNKLSTSAPKVFSQDWNNDFIIKTIEETKSNILANAEKASEIKTYFDLTKDDFQVLELVSETQNEEKILFITEFH